MQKWNYYKSINLVRWKTHAFLCNSFDGNATRVTQIPANFTDTYGNSDDASGSVK